MRVPHNSGQPRSVQLRRNTETDQLIVIPKLQIAYFSTSPHQVSQPSTHRRDVTIPEPTPRPILFHLLHLAYPNLTLCRLSIHLPRFHPLTPLSHTSPGFHSMVYEMEPGSYHHRSKQWWMGVGLD